MVRTEPGLQQVLSETNVLRSDVLPRLAVRGEGAARHNGLRGAIELDGQTELCRCMIAVAALERKESRGGFFGGHYRTDYPDRDDRNWLTNVILSKHGDEICIRHQTPEKLDDISDVAKDVMATAWQPPDDPEHYAEAE